MDVDQNFKLDSLLLSDLLSQDLLAIDCSGKVNIVALQYSGGGAEDLCADGTGLAFTSTSLDSVLGKSILLSRLPSGSDELDILSSTVNDLVAYVKAAGRGLSAIVLGQGPGSFTGLRIATAIAQGLALGFKVPLIEISSFAIAHFALRAMAEDDLGLGNECALGSAVVRGAGKGSWFYSELREGSKNPSNLAEEDSIPKGDCITRYPREFRIQLLSDEQLKDKITAKERANPFAKLYRFEGEECNLVKTISLNSQTYGENIFRALRKECEQNNISDESHPSAEIPYLTPRMSIYQWSEVHKATPLYLRPVAAKSLKDRGFP